MATAADTRTLPYDWYVDPAMLRVEQERIFADAWQYAGPLAKVSEPRQRGRACRPVTCP